MDSTTQRLMMGASGSGGPKIYVEDVFSTWLYTGNGSTQTITNGIDLSGKGGLVWIKSRSAATGPNLQDTANGTGTFLSTWETSANRSLSDAITAFNSNGFSLGSGATYNRTNTSPDTYASWAFRKAAKFFDVVTYTGNGSNRTIAHNLGSVPGCIVVKRTDTTGDWQVYHRSLANTEYMVLNNTAAKATGTTRWNSTTPTSTVFTLGTDATVNASGGSYVAYLFAHDAGGFGDSGNDNVISCGSFTTTSGGAATVTLGYEPQWVLTKAISTTGDWRVFDTMRGYAPGQQAALLANTTATEATPSNFGNLETNGFTVDNFGNTVTYVYIAIRRGPMKTPTDATKVFVPSVYTGTNLDNRLVSTGIVTDMAWVRQRNDSVLGGMVVGDRLRGQPYLLTGSTAAEVIDTAPPDDSFDQQLVGSVEYGNAWSSMTGFWVGNDATAKLNANTTSNNHVAYAFRRAPGFFDVVAYTGTGSARTVSHNLGVAPELMIVKARSVAYGWRVYAAPVFNPGLGGVLALDETAAATYGSAPFNDTLPTSSVFSLGGSGAALTNENGRTYIAYLFASCPGVSKVGSYTGTGTTLNIDCGFTNGARFVLIKRTDSTGDWYVWDTARGIVSANDPYLLLNSTAAEVTNTDYIDPLSSGFQISSTAPAAINANGGSFIYLAIA